MTVRPDNRLADAPMTPVQCRRCAAGVLVRKSSREQTSVQWNAAALQAYDERREYLASDGFFLGCGALGATIGDAVRDHSLIIVDGG
jgi:hypothetical protein